MKQSDLIQFQDYKNFDNIHFLKETCEQINKDLSGFTELKIRLTERLLNSPLPELISQLKPIIIYLEQSNSLKPFIYSVDLHEKKYMAYALKEQVLSQFSYHIIERCAQKVFFRWRFSNKLNH